MNTSDIQHPDITAAERTGYPFPRQVQITVTEDLAKEFCQSNFDIFWYSMMICHSDAVTDFLDQYHQEFDEFITDI